MVNYLAYKFKLRSIPKEYYNKLYTMSNYSKDLYNQTNFLVKQYLKYTGSYLSNYQTYYLMQERENLQGEINFKKLKTVLSQNVLKILDQNWKSYFKALKDYRKNPHKYLNMPRPPGFIQEKEYDLIYDKRGFKIYDGNKVKFGKDFGKYMLGLPKQLHNKNIKTITLKYKYKYFECIVVYEDENNYTKIKENNNVMGIDLGLNNLASCITNTGEKPFIINGKQLKSINQYYNKKQAKIKTINKKVNNQDWSNGQQQLLTKRNNKLNDYLHKASKFIANHCVKSNISKVVIGDLSKSYSSINIGKRNNQNFVNISLGQFIRKIKYKLERHQIKVVITNEMYTSKASFLDNDTLPDKLSKSLTFSGKRIKRGLYKTKTGILINSDINGAYNILRKEVPNFNCKKLFDGIGVHNLCLHNLLVPSKFNLV